MSERLAHRGSVANEGGGARRWSASGLPGLTIALTATATLIVLGGAPALAQGDPSGAWRTWTTPHFRVHAHARNAGVALQAAAEAERAYRLLASELAPPRGVVDLTLYDNTDFSNGFTTVFPSNRIVVYLTPPAGEPQLAPYDHWLRLVITHELTHAFHLDRTRGLWGVLQHVFGRAPGLFPNSYQPSWVAEGLAVYYESRFSTAGRLRGGVHEQLFAAAAAAAAAQWPSPSRATLLSPAWPNGLAPYAWGSAFFQQEQAVGGDSVVPRFVEATAKQLWVFSQSHALKHGGGVDVDSAWNAVHRQWEDSVRGRGVGGRILARGLRTDPRPAVSASGRFLAYVRADGRSNPAIVVLDRPTGTVFATRRVNAQVDLGWVGDTLLVSQLEFRSAVDVWSELYQWKPDGSWGIVPGTSRLGRPAAGPGGDILALDGPSGWRTVRRVSPSGRASAATLPMPPADAWSHVAASGNGWMAGSRHLHGQWDIVVWPEGHPDGARPVTADGAVDDDPAWTPAGDTLLFTSERAGVPQILAYPTRGGELVRLTDEPGGAREPAPAPDGTLHYTTMLDDGWALVALKRPAMLAPAAPRPRPVLPAADTVLGTPGTPSGYRPWPSLWPRYWLPVFHDAGSAGRFGGLLTSGTDAVGRTAYATQVEVAPDRGRLEGYFVAEHRRWKAWAVGGLLQQTWEAVRGRAILENGDTVAVDLARRRRFGNVSLSWRAQRWRTLATARLAAEVEGDELLNDSPYNLQLNGRPDFAGPAVSLAVQHLSRPALAISPENGAAAGITLRRRWELAGNGWYHEAVGTVTGYLALPLPGFAHWVLATRLSGGIQGGPSGRGYDLGGVSGQVFQLIPGYAFGPGRRQFPLRAYPAVSTSFTRVTASALELRVPVALIASGIWKLPFGLDRLSLTAFAETAGGWHAGEPANVSRYRDVGGEAVVDATQWYDVPLRLRLGVAVPLVSGLGVAAGTARKYFAFGTSF